MADRPNSSFLESAPCGACTLACTSIRCKPDVYVAGARCCRAVSGRPNTQARPAAQGRVLRTVASGSSRSTISLSRSAVGADGDLTVPAMFGCSPPPVIGSSRPGRSNHGYRVDYRQELPTNWFACATAQAWHTAASAGLRQRGQHGRGFKERGADGGGSDQSLLEHGPTPELDVWRSKIRPCRYGAQPRSNQA